MRTHARHTTRTAAPAAATAATRDLTYSCERSVGDVDGIWESVARFDTGIEEGLVVEVSDDVHARHFTGELTFPDGLVQALIWWG